MDNVNLKDIVKKNLNEEDNIFSLFSPAKSIGLINGKELYLGFDVINNNVYLYNSYNIKDVLKSHGFLYDPEKKAWYGKKTNFAIVANQIWQYLPKKAKLYALNLGVSNKEIDAIKEKTSDKATDNIVNKVKKDKILDRLFTIVPQLRSYQKEAIVKIINIFFNNRKGFILEDEQGLGKTLVACSVIYALYSNNIVSNVLVLTTNNLVSNFNSEFVKFFSDTGIMRDVSLVPKQNSINILSYSKINSKMYDLIRSYDYDLIVLDEVHVLKSSSSKKFKKIVDIIKKSRFSLAMTGTLMKNRPLEAYNITKVLDFHNYTPYAFVKKFEGPNALPGFSNYRIGFKYYNTVLPDAVKEFRKFLEDTGQYLRRRKKDVLTELPEKMRVYYPINIDSNLVKNDLEISEAIQKEKEIIQLLSKNAKLSNEIKHKISLYRRVLGNQKIPYVLEFLDNFHEYDRLIIFAHHQDVIENIAKLIKEKYNDVIVEVVHGDVNKNERTRIFNLFQSDAEDKIWLVVSFSTTSEGLTLTKSNTIIFAELDWVPGTMWQAEDRIHRISQTRKCMYYYIVAVGTLDQYIYNVLNKKMKYL